MELTYAKRAMQTIAQKEGVSEEQILEEIHVAIQSARDQATAEQCIFRDSVTYSEKVPPALELITLLSEKIANCL